MKSGLAVVAFVTWLAALYKLPRGRRTGPADWALAGTLAALALGLTLKVPAVYKAVDSASGRTNLAQLPKDVSAVLSAFGTQVILLYLVHGAADAGARVRRRALIVAAAVLVMAVGFLLAVTGAEDPQFARQHAASSGLVEFFVVYLAYLAFAFADIVRLCTRFARLAGERLLATGLRLIAAGGAFGIAYVVASGLSLLAIARGRQSQGEGFNSASESLIILATLLVVVGSTMPSWGPRLGLQPRASTRSARAQLAQLEPLWLGLTAAVPDVVLDAAPGQRGRAGLQERLYRRVIEIEDARLSLRPLLTPVVHDAAVQVVASQSHEGETADAAVEGLVLAHIARSRHLLAARGHAVVPARRHDGVPDLEREAAWLGEVAATFTDEDLVGALRRRVEFTHIDLTDPEVTRAHAD